MLEALTDFWKPIKKDQPEEKFQPELLRVGSTIGFGFVPQAILSGRRLSVSAINTYQFGDESLTSFILTQDKDPGVSMIVAESEGEQYLAISRRISTADRSKLFSASDFDAIMTNPTVAKLLCKDTVADYKGWTVVSYKREIQGMKGRIFKGDFRNGSLPDIKEAQEFEYTLLVSESNEHAIEIEKYNDGRIEVYATIYRRMNDVGEITHPAKDAKEFPRSDIKLASVPENMPQAAAPVISQPVQPEPKPEPIQLKELTPSAPVPVQEEQKPLPGILPEPKATANAPQQKPVTATTTNTTTQTPTTTNGASTMSTAMENNMKPKLYVQPTAPQEIKPMTNGINSFNAEAIACDLRVANKIIDEAIRNEMRLSDVVRRIAGLPVEDQGFVQIPLDLSDEDYALLGIRYGISSSDRNSIKRRIIEDLNEFSGGNATKKAA